jgi:hypothetical protein
MQYLSGSYFTQMASTSTPFVPKGFHRYKISVLTLVSSVMYQLVNHPDIRDVDPSSVQNIGSGAVSFPGRHFKNDAHSAGGICGVLKFVPNHHINVLGVYFVRFWHV